MTKTFVASSSWESAPPNFTSISPLDGRNYHKIAPLSGYFSELALNRSRLVVETTYLVYLAKIRVAPALSEKDSKKVLEIAKKFDESAMREVRKIEHTTNHDVKAIEYYLKEQLGKLGLASHQEYVHWAVASEDVNNLAYALLLRDYHQEILLPLSNRTLESLASLAERADFPMLGRTHGQPASVTTLGKELAVYLSRFQMTLELLKNTRFHGKLGGAVGSYADQLILDPTRDWPTLLNDYIASLALEPVIVATQIAPYEPLSQYFSHLKLLQETAIDLCQNLWWYVSFDYFVQAKKENEVGSSIMPHKINPIYLEGAEGGFQMSNAMLGMYSSKFTSSRLQRDLSDTTVRRSFGIAFGYSYLSWQSVIEALERLTPNPVALERDLDRHYEILAGPIQNLLRTRGFDKPYETMKTKTRGKTLSREEMTEIIRSLQLDPAEEKRLLALTPSALSTVASKLAKKVTTALRKAQK